MLPAWLCFLGWLRAPRRGACGEFSLAMSTCPDHHIRPTYLRFGVDGGPGFDGLCQLQLIWKGRCKAGFWADSV